jgi:hypothetical protein
MIEPEMAFADLGDNATPAEGLLKSPFETLLEEGKKITPSSTNGSRRAGRET